MFNRVILVGNLTRDIELRYLPSGSAISSTGIATNRRFKKQDGSAGEEVCFIDISLFGRTAEIANQYLKKGSKILVEGRLKLDTWTDQSGQKRSKHTIVVDNLQMLDSKNQDRTDNSYVEEEYHQQPVQQNQNYQQNAQKQNIPEIDIDEDEIPF
ncbi:MAG: single-stranded DNA-binding protein [Campylobacteraceae bacterium]|jgi:single-strand DNA-binding protein|nr:single-stranded DNA-binding protein [Campylobacteraceae bacterium]